MDDSARSTIEEPADSSDYTPPARKAARDRTAWMVIACLASVYLVWGSTYLAIRVALASFAPFQMAGIRFLIAGALLFGWLKLRGHASPTARQWQNSAVTGTLLLVGGNGLVCFAEQTVSSGLAAVAVASMPLFAALFARLYGQWPSRTDAVGLAIGFAGVIALNFGGGMLASPLGALALIGAPIAWAFGSVWSKHQDMPNAMMSTAAQMLCGGVALNLVSLGLGEPLPHAPTLEATLALAYLIGAGSLMGLTAYIWLLGNVRPALATSYAYVNPPIAVLIGVVFVGERIGVTEIAAMIVILGGVALILRSRA